MEGYTSPAGLLVIGLLFGALLGGLGGYFFGEGDGLTQALQNQTQSQYLVSHRAPQPAAAQNPLQNIKTNPFE